LRPDRSFAGFYNAPRSRSRSFNALQNQFVKAPAWVSHASSVNRLIFEEIAVRLGLARRLWPTPLIA
jgi:hypothetical protein